MVNIVFEITGSLGFFAGVIALGILGPREPSTALISLGLFCFSAVLGPARWLHRRVDRTLRSRHLADYFALPVFCLEAKKKLDVTFLWIDGMCIVLGLCLILLGLLVHFLASEESATMLALFRQASRLPMKL